MVEEKLEEIDLGSNPQEPKPILISSRISEEEKSEFILLLKEFKDVFVWDYNEMPGLDLELVVHTLNVDLKAKLVAQPAMIFHIEIEEQTVKEVQKLLAVGFIKPIQHPHWLSNIVPLKKKNRQIRCCVDFRTPISNFYYTVMPFGSKNTGTTYQRTMTAIFHDMMHRELEDYVNDIVMKLKRREEHV